jgi:hypothetical protein
MTNTERHLERIALAFLVPMQGGFDNVVRVCFFCILTDTKNASGKPWFEILMIGITSLQENAAWDRMSKARKALSETPLDVLTPGSASQGAA